MRSCYYMTAAISLSRHVCAAQRCSSAVGPCLSAQAQLGPACRSDHEQDQHLAASVCGMQQAERRKYLNMPKSNMPKHAERRNMPEDKHAENGKNNMPERPSNMLEHNILIKQVEQTRRRRKQCHVKSRWISPNATPATQSLAASWTCDCATPAT